MNIWKLSLENIKSKPLYSLLSVLMLSLSIGLLLGTQQLKSSFEYQMENNLGDIDMVVGAKGSPLQLVLSSVLHLDNPTGNIYYKEAAKLKRNRLIKKAVPISYGDNYKGFRIVGTTEDFLSFYDATLQSGNKFEKSFEVIIGHSVAEKLQLTLGDTFKSSHGLIDNQLDVHDDEFIIVGILEPTQKVIDRLIVTPLESIWDVHNHDDDDNHNEQEHDDKHHIDDSKEITSLLISFRSPTGLLTMPRNINENTNMQAALPKFELDRLYEFTGVGIQTITWIAYIILIISGMIIFISLYRMIKDRGFDLALLRTFGASNLQLIKMVLNEGLFIVLSGLVFGYLLTKGTMYALIKYTEESSQTVLLREISLNELLPILSLVFVIIIFAVAMAIYPIIKMNISTILSNEK